MYKTLSVEEHIALIINCGGQMVSVLAFYSDDPSSNPAED